MAWANLWNVPLILVRWSNKNYSFEFIDPALKKRLVVGVEKVTLKTFKKLTESFLLLNLQT